MHITYHEDIKNKKNNPFLKMSTSHRSYFREHILKIVFYIAETHTHNPEVYEAFTAVHNASTDFGKSSVRGKPNTALAALTGAAEKLGRGDLSKNQLSNIANLLDWAADNIPGCTRITFENIAAPKPTTPYEKLFEARQ